MVVFMTVEDIIKKTNNIIRKYLSGEYKVILFGSQAKGTALPHPIMAFMRNEIDNLRTFRSIDLIDLLTIDKQYRDNVLVYGKEIEY